MNRRDSKPHGVPFLFWYRIKLKLGDRNMKIEIYVKNKDIEMLNKHLKKFLIQHLKDENKAELQKSNKIDILNHSLSDKNYIRIVNFYIDDNLFNGALTHLAELLTKSIEIRIIFKYSSHGNTILVNHNEIISFIQKDKELRQNIVNKLYQ